MSYDVNIDGPESQNYSGVHGTSLDVDSLGEGGTYYVYVYALLENGEWMGAQNNGLSFLVYRDNLTPFTITGPASPCLNQAPTITWTPSVGAVSYTVAVADDAACTVPVQAYPELPATQTQVTLSGPLPFRPYFVCVTAFDYAGDVTQATNYGYEFVIAPDPATHPRVHTIFVTSTDAYVTNSDSMPPDVPFFGGLDSADWSVTYAAYNAGLVPNWDWNTIVYKAVLSSTSASAYQRIQIRGAVYNMNNQIVAADANQFWSGATSNPVMYQENGAPAPNGTAVWTGTLPMGYVDSAETCGDWTAPTLNGTVGNATAGDATWMDASQQTCTSSGRFYGISP